MSFTRRAVALGLLMGTLFPLPQTAFAQVRDLSVVEPDEDAKPQRRPQASKPRPVKPQASEAGPKMMVSLVPKGSTFISVGDPYRFSVVASQNGYGHVYVASASGKMQVWAENVKLASGKPVSMPPSGLKIVASAPAGDDTIYFFATRDRFVDGFFQGATVRKPADIQMSERKFLSTVKARLSNQPSRRWAYTTQVIRVED